MKNCLYETLHLGAQVSGARVAKLKIDLWSIEVQSDL